jgi:hypothetical protein
LRSIKIEHSHGADAIPRGVFKKYFGVSERPFLLAKTAEECLLPQIRY